MPDLIGRIKERFVDKVLRIEEKSQSRVYIEFKPADIPAAARFLFQECALRFATATGIDTPAGIEILYHFSHDATGKVVSLRTIIPDKKNPKIESLATFIRGAEWIEREMWELLGIDFIGHPNLKRLLLSDEWPEGKYPLRKDEP